MEVRNVIARKRSAVQSSYVELERLEPAADGGTAGALPSGSLLCHEHLDAGGAEAANAFGTGVRAPKKRDALAGGAVDLNVLRRIGWRGVGQAAGAHVKVFAALDAGEGLDRVLVVRGRGKCLLQRGRLVVVLLQILLGEGRHGGSVNRHGGLWHLKWLAWAAYINGAVSAYRSAVFINVTSSGSCLVRSINQILPPLAKVGRGLNGEGLAVTRSHTVIVLNASQPIGSRAARVFLPMALLGSLRNGLLSGPAGTHGSLQRWQGGRPSWRRPGEQGWELTVRVGVASDIMVGNLVQRRQFDGRSGDAAAVHIGIVSLKKN